MNREELAVILDNHELWLSRKEGGVCADLMDANLRYANLEGANLSYANLEGANLGGAALEGVTMSEVFKGETQ